MATNAGRYEQGAVLIRTGNAGSYEASSNITVKLEGKKGTAGKPVLGGLLIYGASTVGGGEPVAPIIPTTGSGQIFPTGRQ